MLVTDSILPLDRHTLNVELGALIEQTKATSSGAGADEVTESTSEQSLIDISSISGVGCVVTAGELCLVATFGLGLLDSHVIGNREPNLSVSLVSNTIGVTNATGGGPNWWQRSHSGGEADESCERELHFDGVKVKQK